MVTTFHLFPHLPWEIRSRIWVLTVEPREVEVRSKTQHTRLTDELAAKYNLRNLKDRFGIKVHNFYSSTPVPAPLQACREARSHLTRHGRQNSAHYTYRQVFRQTAPRAVPSDFPYKDWEKGMQPELPPELWLEPKLRLKLGLDNEPRYIWVNFDVDMIDIGEGMFYAYEPYYLEIKRLKLARESHCELWHGRWYDGEIGWFANAEEIHVVCLEDSRRAIECWEDAHEEHGFPCDIDKLLLIDPKNGRRVTAAENDAAVKAERWARYRANGAFINPDTLQPFVPFLPEGWFEGQEDWDAYYWDEYYMNRS